MIETPNTPEENLVSRAYGPKDSKLDLLNHHEIAFESDEGIIFDSRTDDILNFNSYSKQQASCGVRLTKIKSDTISRTSKSTISHQSSSSTGNNAHLRLYQCSLSRQQEGKERREKIEKARKPTPPKLLIITEHEAEKIVGRLYCERSIVFKRQEVANEIAKKTSCSNIGVEKKYGLENEDTRGTSNAGISKRPMRRMKEKNAQIMFDRLHSEKMAKGVHIIIKQKKRVVNCLPEPLAQKLFERLYSEKKKGDLMRTSKQGNGSRQ